MNGSTLVSTGELAANLAKWRVFDCRLDLANPKLGGEQYREAHVPGALFAHLDRDLSGRKTGANGRHPLPDPKTTTSGIYCLSAESRGGVDELCNRALEVGGSPAGATLDYGFMYGRSFCDPDGHHWEVVWMDQKAAEEGPPKH